MSDNSQLTRERLKLAVVTLVLIANLPKADWNRRTVARFRSSPLEGYKTPKGAQNR
jgi:hypothetical protein